MQRGVCAVFSSGQQGSLTLHDVLVCPSPYVDFWCTLQTMRFLLTN